MFAHPYSNPPPKAYGHLPLAQCVTLPPIQSTSSHFTDDLIFPYHPSGGAHAGGGNGRLASYPPMEASPAWVSHHASHDPHPPVPSSLIAFLGHILQCFFLHVLMHMLLGLLHPTHLMLLLILVLILCAISFTLI